MHLLSLTDGKFRVKFDPLRRDKGLLRQVAQRGVSVARLVDKRPAAGRGESPWAEAVDRQSDITPILQLIGELQRAATGEAGAAMKDDDGRERTLARRPRQIAQKFRLPL